MKAVKYLAIVLAGIFLFAACQKEFSFENGNPATGSLKDTSGNCLPITTNGTYIVDSTLSDSNFITVQVRFTSAGSYVISTDTSNGFSFSATGSVKDPGLQNIRLLATGKPAVAQLTNFFVAFDSSVCTFSIPVTASISSGGTAIYTLAGSPNNCSNANVQGDYTAGTPLISSNLVSIEVNVDSVGTYSISAGPANGMSFSAQGAFTSNGVQTVILQGTGTPTTAGTTTVPVNAGGTSCSFTVTVNGGAVAPAADSAWQFSEGGKLYHGSVDSSLMQTVILQPDNDTANALSFYGSTSPNSDTSFQVDILLPNDIIQTGIYNTELGEADFFLYNNKDSAITPFYRAYDTATLSPDANIQINIQTYDPVTKIVTATFSGTAVNGAGNVVQITGGKVYAKVD